VLAQVEAPEILHAPELPSLDGAAASLPHRPSRFPSSAPRCLLSVVNCYVLVKW
jgi:hypothetical protein